MKNKLLHIIKNNLPIYLAHRRLLPKSDFPGVVLLPRLAFTSIVTGVAASILILSLANGLHNNYLKKLADSESHITLVSAGRGIPAYQEIIQTIKKMPDIVNVYPFSQNEALLKSYGETAGVIIKSYPEEFATDPSFNNNFRLQEGNWSFTEPRTITIGETLARNMALFVGDFVEILSYDETFGAITYRFKISGIFTANDALTDSGLTFINFNDAEEIFDFTGYTPSIGITIKDYLNPEKYTQLLTEQIPFRFKTWKLTNLNTLLALNNEKQIIRVLLFIFFCVAFFGILAVMTALVADKREEIALLKALGMSPKDNTYSFILTGLFLGIFSSFIGMILGILLSNQFNNIIKLLEGLINIILYYGALILQQTPPQQFHFLNQSVYYLKEFPILIQWYDIIFSAFLAIICTLLAAIYPAYISRNFNPSEILRKRAF